MQQQSNLTADVILGASAIAIFPELDEPKKLLPTQKPRLKIYRETKNEMGERA